MCVVTQFEIQKCSKFLISDLETLKFKNFIYDPLNIEKIRIEMSFYFEYINQNVLEILKHFKDFITKNFIIRLRASIIGTDVFSLTPPSNLREIIGKCKYLLYSDYKKVILSNCVRYFYLFIVQSKLEGGATTKW